MDRFSHLITAQNPQAHARGYNPACKGGDFHYVFTNFSICSASIFGRKGF